MTKSKSRWNHWLQLIRFPNLFTVPGDPVAGFLLAGGALFMSLAYATMASLLLYTVGLISNDLADIHEDLRDRPQRPLPARHISLKAARTACILLTGIAIILGFLASWTTGWIAIALLFCILVYNYLLKKVPWIGGLSMGTCRSLNVLLGASVVSSGLPVAVIIFALLAGGYIAAVSFIAADETRRSDVRIRRWLPALLCFSMVIFSGILYWPAALPALAAMALALQGGKKLGAELSPRTTPPIIGLFIRNLLPLQAACCFAAGLIGPPFGVLLIAAYPLAGYTSRKFYAS